MEVVKVLHMNQGNGETSYANNSTVQSKIISLAKPATEEAIGALLRGCLQVRGTVPETLGIADLGCSSGPNAFRVVSEIIDVVFEECLRMDRPVPELGIYLNDLPSNDFNNVFGSLPDFYKRLKEEKGDDRIGCFVSATAGSFYGRLFSKNSLHFVHSSSSLHWLSQVPAGLANCGTMNRGKLYISKTSPKAVVEAYTRQFQDDFSMFLSSRAHELVPGGRMVLSFMGRTSNSDPTDEVGCYQWELLARALMSMVDDGLVEEEKVDLFNAPYYAPSRYEVRTEVEREGSFEIDRVEAFEIEWDGGRRDKGGGGATETTRGETVAMTVRAVVESMVEAHFGGGIGDELFRRYAVVVDDYLCLKKAVYVNLVVTLVRRD
ncbi:unnamed protein product [Linum trigynum]|uniref:Jasmonate O-methyltransferase n=1 Tax=Linum trigynum TaxID=586398 RepID=A0AAV2EDV2_9ROSI